MRAEFSLPWVPAWSRSFLPHAILGVLPLSPWSSALSLLSVTVACASWLSPGGDAQGESRESEEV